MMWVGAWFVLLVLAVLFMGITAKKGRRRW